MKFPGPAPDPNPAKDAAREVRARGPLHPIRDWGHSSRRRRMRPRVGVRAYGRGARSEGMELRAIAAVRRTPGPAPHSQRTSSGPGRRGSCGLCPRSGASKGNRPNRRAWPAIRERDALALPVQETLPFHGRRQAFSKARPIRPRNFGRRSPSPGSPLAGYNRGELSSAPQIFARWMRVGVRGRPSAVASPGRARGEGQTLAWPKAAFARGGAFPANTERLVKGQGARMRYHFRRSV